VDTDGYTDEPCGLRAAVELDAERVRFDMTGCDPQRRAPVNSTYAMTFSACAYALKCLIDPDLPVNDGFYRVLDVHAPTGTVANCTWPAPVVGRVGDADAARRRACSSAMLPAFPSGCRRGRRR
jgi:N-methylhydantoinase B